MEALEPVIAVLAFVWGAIWGSFANVAIYRLPRGESLVTPPSHCPHCGTRIAWFQNVPLLSYVILGGKCGYAECRQPISIRYPLVELVVAALTLAAWMTVAANPHVPEVSVALGMALFLFGFLLALVIITFIDLEHMIIPDVISIPCVGLGLAYNALFGEYTGVSWLSSLIGALAGAGGIAAVIVGFRLLTGREGMGWGDAKLMAMLGAFLGWPSLFFILLAGSLQGILYAIPWYLTGTRDTGFRRAMIPFGPFLALAGMEWLFFSAQIESLFQRVFSL
jgi:leader peptidase (prepilin peptidase)/N-methyltransferase